MKKTLNVLILSCVFSMSAVVAVCGGLDWPQFLGPGQNGISMESGLAPSWPAEGPHELWRRPSGTTYAGVAVVGSKVYTLESRDKEEWVVCLDSENGDKIWEALNDEDFTPGKRKQFPYSTPLIHEGRVYTTGCHGALSCLDAETGERIWGFNILEKFNVENRLWGYANSPVAVNGTILISAGAPGGGGVAALDRNTGEIVWTGLDAQMTYSTPLLIEVDGRSLAVLFAPDQAVGFNPATGEQYWSYPWVTENGNNIITPSCDGNRLFISSAYGVGSALLNLKEENGKPAIEEIWKKKDFENWYNHTLFIDGYLYGFDLKNLKCVDAATGEDKWSQRGFERGQLAMADGRLIVLGEKGNVALVEASPEIYKEISQFQAVQGKKCWTMPTIAHGKLYVRGEGELVCFDLRP